ncbi:MAG: hypothetical protein WA620_10420 [Methylovirgula sp.]
MRIATKPKGFSMILGFSLILVAITLLGIDCWNWLNTGVFAPVSLATIWQAAGLTEPVFDSETVQSIATDFFHVPLSIFIALGGILLTRQGRSMG